MLLPTDTNSSLCRKRSTQSNSPESADHTCSVTRSVHVLVRNGHQVDLRASDRQSILHIPNLSKQLRNSIPAVTDKPAHELGIVPLKACAVEKVAGSIWLARDADLDLFIDLIGTPLHRQGPATNSVAFVCEELLSGRCCGVVVCFHGERLVGT